MKVTKTNNIKEKIIHSRRKTSFWDVHYKMPEMRLDYFKIYEPILQRIFREINHFPYVTP